VITVSFKDAKGKTFGAAMRAIRDQIIMATNEHRVLIEPEKINVTTASKIRQLLDDNVTNDELQLSFKWLSQALHEYHKQRVVLLIDEYDTPLHNAYIEGYYDDMISFYKTFLSACLKDNSSCTKAY
jgi:hypothetical protein